MAPPATEAEQRAQLARTIERTSAILDTHIDSQEPEPAWADTTETEITEFVAADDQTGVDLAQVECKRSACRVELNFRDELALKHFVETASRVHPWRYQAQMVPQDPDDVLSVSLYIAREGHSLPPL